MPDEMEDNDDDTGRRHTGSHHDTSGGIHQPFTTLRAEDTFKISSLMQAMCSTMRADILSMNGIASMTV